MGGFSLSYSTPNNTLLPCEGPRAAHVQLNFTSAQIVVVDYNAQQASNQMSMVQALFIDNSNNSAQLSCLVNGSNQLIEVAPNSQGYYPVLAPNPPKFTFTTTGTVIVNVFLLNYPVLPQNWSVNASGGGGGGGNVTVTGITAPSIVQFSNQRLLPQPAIDTPITGSLTFAGNSPSLLAPPFYISCISLTISPDATQATAGPFEVIVTSPYAGNVFTAEFYVPSTAPTYSTPVSGPTISTPPNWGYYNNDSIDSLYITLPAGLATGKLTYNIAYNSTP